MPDALAETTGGIMFETSIGGKRGLGLCDWRKSLSTDLLACRMKLCRLCVEGLLYVFVRQTIGEADFSAGFRKVVARVAREN